MRYKLFSKKEKPPPALLKEIDNLKSQVNELTRYKDYVDLVESINDYYYFEYNFKSGKLKCSEKLFSILGYSQNDIPTTLSDIKNFIHQNDLQTITAELQHPQTLKGNTCYCRRFRMLTHTNKWIWLNGSAKITEWNAHHVPIKLTGIVNSIATDKKDQIKLIKRQERIKDELKDKDEHLKDLARILPEIVFETDEKGNVSFINEKAYEIFGFTHNDFQKGINIFTFIADKDKARVKENFYKTAKEDNVKGNEYEAITNTGEHIPVLVYSTPIFRNDLFAGTRGIIVTIKELKKSRENLQKSEENFRQLAENIQDCFWLIDLNNELIYSNKNCKAMIEADLSGPFKYPDIFFKFIHPEDKASILTEIKSFQKNPLLKHSYEHRIVTSSGKTKWISVRIFPVLDNNGNLYRKAGVATDITQKKFLIQELIKAKNKAEEADRLKSSFLANMSHEIRTPMNGILGFAELLKDPHTTPSEKMEYINIIQNNGKHLLNLINDIIDFAKIEAGELTIIKKPFDVKLFMTNIYKTYKNQYKNRLQNIDFTCQMEPADFHPTLYSDAFRIEQVLINFLTNAFKFTTKGTIEIGYEMNHKTGNEQYIKFYVRDTGAGINKKDQKAIFERFGQVMAKSHIKQEGTGLGLAISRNLIHLLGGEIGVESTPNKGSLFYFYLPYETKEEPAEQIDSNEQTNEIPTLKNKTILIVEDDQDNMEFLKKLLQIKNMNFLTASTGEKAVDLVKKYKSIIDLVLMDIRLPGMDGYDATIKIKGINKSLPVIAQTAYALDSDHNKSIEMGCDDHLSKPIKKDVLFEKLNHYIYINKKE